MNTSRYLAETFLMISPKPLLVRLVERSSDRVVREFRIEPDWTGPEVHQWALWLEKVCGPDYCVEVPAQATDSSSPSNDYPTGTARHSIGEPA